jgi:hypothetical protein
MGHSLPSRATPVTNGGATEAIGMWLVSIGEQAVSTLTAT